MYNINVEVTYNDDDEYRAMLCNVFYSEQNEYSHAITSGMDYVWNATHSNPLFIKLYTSAASKLMSEDPSMGLAILFSYDYLAEFHILLGIWFRTPELIVESSKIYIDLVEDVGKK